MLVRRWAMFFIKEMRMRLPGRAGEFYQRTGFDFVLFRISACTNLGAQALGNGIYFDGLAHTLFSCPGQ